MKSFDNVTIEKKANIYFEGKVTSRTVVFPDASRKTLGIMLPGKYEFGTDTAEIMEIQSGNLKVLLPGAKDWLEVSGDQSFNVPAKSKFKLEVRTVVDYCCSYVTL